MNIMSKVDGSVIARYCCGDQVASERVNLSDDNEILQGSCKRLSPGCDFTAHIHLPVMRTTQGTQESWVVVKGCVRVILYDVDESVLYTLLLNAGDCLLTFRGGHSMTILEDTLLYEFKNGPYFGHAQDKKELP